MPLIESLSDTISRDRIAMLLETIPGMQVKVSAHGLLDLGSGRGGSRGDRHGG